MSDFGNDSLLIASHNDGKVKEIADLLQSFPLKIFSAKQLHIAEIEETADDFAGNAKLKSEFCAQQAKMPALADDSGLCVCGLDDAPGIYSARLAKKHGGFREAMAWIEEELQRRDCDNNRAYFICVLALSRFDREGNLDTKIFTGRVDGHLTFPPKGCRGFGYDSIFIPENHQQSFGEMLPERKHAISHRFAAFAQLTHYLQTL